MEVRSGDAAGGAHLSEHLAGLQLVADFHVHFGKVAIEGINPEAVIDNHGVAGKEQFLGQRYARSEEHTSELQSHSDLVCRLLLEKKKKKVDIIDSRRYNYIREQHRTTKKHYD